MALWSQSGSQSVEDVVPVTALVVVVMVDGQTSCGVPVVPVRVLWAVLYVLCAVGVQHSRHQKGR
jgi:hypothetical protein